MTMRLTEKLGQIEARKRRKELQETRLLEEMKLKENHEKTLQDKRNREMRDLTFELLMVEREKKKKSKKIQRARDDLFRGIAEMEKRQQELLQTAEIESVTSQSSQNNSARDSRKEKRKRRKSSKENLLQEEPPPTISEEEQKRLLQEENQAYLKMIKRKKKHHIKRVKQSEHLKLAVQRKARFEKTQAKKMGKLESMLHEVRKESARLSDLAQKKAEKKRKKMIKELNRKHRMELFFKEKERLEMLEAEKVKLEVEQAGENTGNKTTK